MPGKIEPQNVNEPGISPFDKELRERWNVLVMIYSGEKIADRYCRLVTGKPLIEMNKKQKKLIGRTLAQEGARFGWDKLAETLWAWENNPEYFENQISNTE